MVVAGFVIGAVGFGTTGPADAHFLGYSSVDDCEIRWEDETTWDAERQAAHGAWESLRGDSCVDLAPDAWHTNADLQWKDANRTDVVWIGAYEHKSNADNIFLNSAYMSLVNACTRKNVAMHEMGHAHGLDHSSNSATGNVMNEYQIAVCQLKPHDIADYEALWGPSDPPPPPRPNPTPPTHTP
jgi:hypothetical protein